MELPRWRGLVGVLAAQAVAWTGTSVSTIALPWFVLSTTGSALQTGLIVFVELTPYVVFQLLSGPLIDRQGPRRISIVGDLVSMAAVALIPLLYALDALSLWTLLPLVAGAGAFRGPADAAKAIFIPAAVSDARVPIERGTGLSSMIQRLSATIGPAAAGVVVATLGGPYALIITAALFGLGAVIIAGVAPKDPVVSGEAQAGYLARFRDGAAFLRQDRLLRSMTVMTAITNFLDAAWSSVLLPVWARDTGHGPEAIGLVLGCMSASATLFSLVAAAYAHRLPRRPLYMIGFLVAGAPRFVVLAIGAPLWAIVAVYIVSGCGSGFINPILGAVSFERVPRPLYGRVRTLMGAINWIGVPFGGLVGGGLVTAFGFAPAVLACGGAYFVATMLPGLQKEWKQMDSDRRSAHPDASA